LFSPRDFFAVDLEVCGGRVASRAEAHQEQSQRSLSKFDSKEFFADLSSEKQKLKACHIRGLDRSRRKASFSPFKSSSGGKRMVAVETIDAPARRSVQ
jgi:hypothetical protein